MNEVLLFRKDSSILSIYRAASPITGTGCSSMAAVNEYRMAVAVGTAMRLVMRKYGALLPKWYRERGSVAIWQQTESDIVLHSHDKALPANPLAHLLPSVACAYASVHTGKRNMIPSTALYESWNPMEVICRGEIVQLMSAARAIASVFPTCRKHPLAIL